MSSPEYIEQRLADLSQNIQENMKLLRAYERKRRLSKEPREQEDLDDQIADVKKLMEKDRKEKEVLESERDERGNSSKKNIEHSLAGMEIEIVPSEQLALQLREDMLQIKDKLDSGFDDMRRRQDDLHRVMTYTRNEELKSILDFIQAGNISQQDMEHTLKIIRESLNVLQVNQARLSAEMQEAVTNAHSALSTELGLQGKLELTLPIIPAILDYKVELAASDAVELNQFFENAHAWWNSLTKRTHKNLWSIYTLEEYGRSLQARDKNQEPLQVGREALQQYRADVESLHRSVIDFDAKINQGASNLNLVIQAREYFDHLQKASERFLTSVTLLSEKPNYPKHDLERIDELARSIVAQLDAAAGAIANNANPAIHIHQVKRNLPTLRRILEQLLSWLDQMKTI